jgi:hypothetical protein
MASPMKGYRVVNLAEVTVTDNPDPGFLYLFPRDGKWVSRNSAGEEEILGSVVFDQITGIPIWDDEEEYTLENGDVYVIHVEKFWKLIQATSTGDEPGDSLAWEELDFSALTHIQNTDYKLGRHALEIRNEGGAIDMTTKPLFGINYLILNPDTALAEVSFVIRTRDLALTFGEDHEIYVVVPPDAVCDVKFETDVMYMDIPTDSVVLSPGDWAVFKGMINGKTAMVNSNKLLGVGGGGGNPFDQDLNKASSVQFAAVKVTGIARANGVVTVDATGQQSSADSKDISTVVFDGHKFRDLDTDEVFILAVVSGEVTLIPVA